MKALTKMTLLVFALSVLPSCTTEVTEQQTENRTHNFNDNWQFLLTEGQDQRGPLEISQASQGWKKVSVPHDWSITQGFDKQYDGATAYLPGGVGWYRKNFKAQDLVGKQVYLYFDGVYANSTVWLNGQQLGGRINGYIPFYFDVSKLLNADQNNTLLVKVDHQNYIDSRWYTGSGIYRDVELIVTDKLHIDVWGTFVTTPSISEKSATVAVETPIKNNSNDLVDYVVKTQVIDPNGKVVSSASDSYQLASGESQTIKQSAKVAAPMLWDINTPHLYQLKQFVIVSDQIVDSNTTRFGIRSFNFDAKTGFTLNGKNIKIKGVNLHHDAGLVGTAVPDDVWRRRLISLKEMGTNAIRTAHNPVSKNFLDMCDELGLLVQAEIFDEWDNPKDKRLNQWERHSDEISRGYAEHFQQEAERDLKDSMLRDRNHPSIIQWSIGNEIEWTYPRYKAATGYFDMNAQGNYFYNPPFISPEEIYQRFHSSEEGQYVLAKTAQKLSKWVKEVDTTRPVTANLILPSVSHISGYTDALDVVGYSYRRVIYDYGHKLFPDKPIMGTENVVQWHEWQAIEERDFISGTFLWTGIDYLGEAHNAWPRKVTPSGMLDTAGFEKPSFHMFKTLWQSEPHIHITSQTLADSLYQLDENGRVEEKEPGKWQQRVWFWQDVNRHWNYQEGDIVIAEVMSNCDAVELFLNDKSLGVEKRSDHPDRIFKWGIPFQAGKLNAKGLGNCNTSDQIITAKAPSGLSLQVDKRTLEADYNQVAHIEMQLIDDANNPVTHQEQKVTVKLSDNLELLGLDSGLSETISNYYSSEILTHQGKALAIVRSLDGQEGDVSFWLEGKKLTTLTLNP